MNIEKYQTKSRFRGFLLAYINPYSHLMALALIIKGANIQRNICLKLHLYKPHLNNHLFIIYPYFLMI